MTRYSTRFLTSMALWFAVTLCKDTWVFRVYNALTWRVYHVCNWPMLHLLGLDSQCEEALNSVSCELCLLLANSPRRTDAFSCPFSVSAWPIILILIGSKCIVWSTGVPITGDNTLLLTKYVKPQLVGSWPKLDRNFPTWKVLARCVMTMTPWWFSKPGFDSVSSMVSNSSFTSSVSWCLQKHPLKVITEGPLETWIEWNEHEYQRD